jgi:DNA replication and repair protein RecF
MKDTVYLLELKLVSFKNHNSLKLSFCKGFNGIAGLNGKGKTNLLDAIHYLTTGKSYFNFSDQQSIQTQTDFTSIIGKLNKQDENFEIIVNIQVGKKKVIKMNGEPCKKLSEFIGNFSSIIITPSDISIVIANSDERRNFMDRVICQCDKVYLVDLNKYNKLLEQRNKALKRMSKEGVFNQDLIATYTQQMSAPAENIAATRRAFIQFVGPAATAIYSELAQSNDTIEMEYTSDLNNATFEGLMETNMAKDRILERTTSGIHKDDLEFKLDNDQSLKKYGSQGQIKSWITAIKLAAMLWLKEKNKQTPILMLDDIFEKIDQNRLENLLNWLTINHDGQWFVTDAHKNRLEESILTASVEKKFFNIDEILT